MKTTLAFLTLTLLTAGTANSAQDAKTLATGVCAACHGPEGRSVSPVFPRLAGQQSAYIVLQLDAFRGHVRGDPLAQSYMWGMSSQLSDETIDALANFYSSQKPVIVTAAPSAQLTEGEKIYAQGIEAQGVPACAACHGAKAEGAAAFPRLAGQHVDYIVAQLVGFQSGVRANAPIMLNVARTMSAEQMRAVALFAASR
jgi:cytochrome c553